MICFFCTWVINIFFWAGLLPQVILNFKLRTTRGLSDLMLFGYFNGYITYCYYVFCFNLPLAYKIMVPLSFATMLIMLVQRFVYEQAYKRERKLLALYLLNALAAVLLIPHAFTHTNLVGNVTGWIEITIWSMYQIPQIFKVHVNKSVFGFSFLLVTLIGLGDLIELIVAIALQFPVQTIVNGFRGVFIYLIFCLQFWLYSQETNPVQFEASEVLAKKAARPEGPTKPLAKAGVSKGHL